MSGGECRSTCNEWNGKKQTFRPAFTSNECNGCHKNPNHDSCRSEKQSRAYEEQCWQYKQAYQNGSSPGKHLDIQNMCSNARGNRNRPNYHNCDWLLSKVRQQEKPQPENGGQGKQATKAGRIGRVIWIFVCWVRFDGFWHKDILVSPPLPANWNPSSPNKTDSY